MRVKFLISLILIFFGHSVANAQDENVIFKSELIFETPNYKVRIGEYKDINIASQKLEGIRRTYPGSFIIKLSEL